MDFSPPKTAKSNGVLPLTKVLLNGMKRLKRVILNCYLVLMIHILLLEMLHHKLVVLLQLEKNRNCELAGVKQIRIHDFRHSCASLLIHKGANIITVSKFLGHTKIEETLNTYTHLYSNALSDITNLIDEMNES